MDLYTQIDLLVLALPLVLSFDRKVAFWRKWPQVFAAIAAVVVVFGAWDAWMAARGIWGFNPQHAGTGRFLHLPAGEWLFFVCVPYACLFVLECVQAYFPDRRWPAPRAAFLAPAGLCLILAGVFRERAYTATVLLACGAVLALLEGLAPATLRSRNFWLALGLTYVPFLVANGFLTGIPIVLYDDAENLAWRVGSIPVEDFCFSFAMLALAALVHDRAGRRDAAGAAVRHAGGGTGGKARAMTNPERAWPVYGKAAAAVLAILMAVGTVGHLQPGTLPLMLKLTPGFGLLTGLVVLAQALARDGWKFAAWVAGTYVFTFAAEAAGVATGAIFGTYTYGPVLGPAWRGVPLLIAFNWVVVVHGACCVAGRRLPPGTSRWRRPALALLAGAACAAFDFLMEPVAVRLDYWRWAGGAIPLQNYAAWFTVATLAGLFHPAGAGRERAGNASGRLAGFYLGLQAVFFLVLQWGWKFGNG